MCIGVTETSIRQETSMNSQRYSSLPQLLRLLSTTCVALVITAGWASRACAQSTETVLHSFTGLRDGAEPIGNLIFDKAGNIYGTTAFGGIDSGNIGCNGGRCGVAFKLSPNANGSWNETLLHAFSGRTDGSTPEGLVSDVSGNLYGTTQRGGNLSGCEGFGCGVVYKLSPNGTGGWNQTVLYSFTGAADGAYPNPGLILDAAGNLYGTTYGGGSSAGICAVGGCGIVFKLSRAVGVWKESIIHTFIGGNDGQWPTAPVVFDNVGNLYGTTYAGGKGLAGTAFRLSKNSNGFWKESTLHAFTGGADGGQVNAGLILDTAGNLYGTTVSGGTGTGSCPNCGVVFELSPSAIGPWLETILHYFAGLQVCFTGTCDGAVSDAPLVFDASGNLWGTTEVGGRTTCVNDNLNCGVVFELSPSPSGWSESSVYDFTGADGENPLSSLTIDASGNLLGTTRFGGTSQTECSNAGFNMGCGVVFKLTP
jgi:hypothetical protein